MSVKLAEASQIREGRRSRADRPHRGGFGHDGRHRSLSDGARSGDEVCVARVGCVRLPLIAGDCRSAGRHPVAREELRRADQRGGPAAMAAANVLRTKPCRIAARQGECRDGAHACSSNGVGTRISSSSTSSIRRPISTTLELITPEHVVLGGQEPPVAEDPSTTPSNAREGASALCRLPG